MGEKIKNLHPIMIGNSELMIELNEGYTEKQGQLIHIQNTHFRYLLNKEDFIILAATVLRADCEKDYYKNQKIESSNTEVVDSCHNLDERIIVRRIKNLLKDFANMGIRYRLVDIGDKYVTILVCNEDYTKYREYIKQSKKFTSVLHPFSEDLGYSYLYKMRPFELFSYKDIFVEFYFQLPCMSLTPKTWIPLDKEIQKWVWGHYEETDNIIYLDAISRLIYQLCWAVFKREAFSQYDINLLEEHKEVWNLEQTKSLLSKIFFNFTDTLLSLLKEGRYTDIIREYYMFNNY